MWIYEHTPDNTARFVLGTQGDNPLVCFGINPSTAEPNNLDPTVNLVSRVATAHGHDSFLMFNVYPQRATNPDHLHRSVDPKLWWENDKYIAEQIAGRPLTIWAAWGTLIEKRDYLFACLNSIVNIPELQNCTWVSRGPITKNGHPHHPLYVRKDSPFEPFDMQTYLKTEGRQNRDKFSTQRESADEGNI